MGEQKDMAKAIDPEAILDRRENKKEKIKEYQTKLMNKSVEDAIWIERSILEKMGMLAKVQREDEKQAMMAGLQQKALTSEGVEKHLVDFGLEVEAASHTTVQSLSGGQKVKVVLAASMWLNPHILILDEPTNYLDRDGLGALTLAIKDFEGGVIITRTTRSSAVRLPRRSGSCRVGAFGRRVRARARARTRRRRERCRRRRCGSLRTSSRSSRRLTRERNH